MKLDLRFKELLVVAKRSIKNERPFNWEYVLYFSDSIPDFKKALEILVENGIFSYVKEGNYSLYSSGKEWNYHLDKSGLFGNTLYFTRKGDVEELCAVLSSANPSIEYILSVRKNN